MIDFAHNTVFELMYWLEVMKFCVKLIFIIELKNLKVYKSGKVFFSWKYFF